MDVHLVEIPGDAPDAPAREEAFQRLAAEDRADGYVILSFLSLTLRHLRPLDEVGVPYVLVNRHFEHLNGPPVNCVVLDWVGATEDAVRRLYGLGHRRMALLMPDSDRSTVWDHEQGWRRGRNACGLDDTAARMVRYPEDDLAGTVEALVGQAKRGDLTAAVCFNDSTAFAVVRAALAAGVRVPEELSVIGFDNRIGDYTTPPLCSYDPHLLEVGKAAAQLMAVVLRYTGTEGESEEPQRITVPAEFVCRGTCARAPGEMT